MAKRKSVGRTSGPALKPLGRASGSALREAVQVPRSTTARNLVLALLLLCAVLVSYIPAINGSPVWDDATHLTRPELRSLQGLRRIWFEIGATDQYYPLLQTAFWIERHLWGDAWAGYHLVNIALHALAALLLVAVLRRLSIPGAWLAAFLFALHPVSVETVAWISEQKNTLSGVFYLAAVLVYLRFDQTRRRRTYGWASALFLMALLGKTVAITLPAALLVIFWWLRGRLGWKRDVLPLLPWLAAGIPLGLITAWMERTIIGARGADFNFTVVERCLIAGRAIWFYLGKIFWPANITFIYPRWNVDAAVWWWYLYPLGALTLAAVLVVVARRNRGPLAGFLYFAGTLFPALGFVNVYPFIFSFVADHFQYMARLGVIVPVAAWAATARSRLPARQERAVTAAAVAVLAVFGYLSWRHSGDFKDADTHYLATIEGNPACWMAHNNLGSDLLEEPGRFDEARAHIEEGLRLKPDNPMGHYNMGRVLERSPERLPQAIAEYREALRLKPDLAAAHDNLGMALASAGQFSEAIEEHRAAVRFGPGFPRFHNNLGTLLARTGRMEEAIPEFREALRLEPAYAEAHNNLGLALASTGRMEEAASEFQAAVQLKPEYASARRNLAAVLAKLGQR